MWIAGIILGWWKRLPGNDKWAYVCLFFGTILFAVSMFLHRKETRGLLPSLMKLSQAKEGFIKDSPRIPDGVPDRPAPPASDLADMRRLGAWLRVSKSVMEKASELKHAHKFYPFPTLIGINPKLIEDCYAGYNETLIWLFKELGIVAEEINESIVIYNSKMANPTPETAANATFANEIVRLCDKAEGVAMQLANLAKPPSLTHDSGAPPQ